MRGGALRSPRPAAPLQAAALVLVAACATTPWQPPTPDLEARISRIVESKPLDQVHWGILAVEAASDRVVYRRNATKKFVPASNMKLLGTSTALLLLGPDFRYRTGLWRAGALDPESGVLDGDLVVGRGDPTLSDRFHPSDAAPLEALVDSLEAVGVRSVSGRLVVDASRWDSTAVPGSWTVANLPWSWAATGGPFAVAEGELTVEVAGAPRPGGPAEVSWWPRGPGWYVVPELSTTYLDKSA